ncbi:baseplate J/gp47 family protein [Caulobacter sp. BK020]|uniref:baseplate J/gp47 family protein n=1 Tax=Caulobacter sp. BK020 TaxID=2512117 RepID=UPI00104FABDB|nr:baseplate J/gp47 family protein [Caulobacter sp. BK020]TCS14444.1 putative phage baseplate assembly protein [Caulobacter sp. BK020]
MPLPAPKLDDRSFTDLMADAIKVIDRSCPEWTDRNPSDPGITLLEAFAYLTDTMLYRLNRVPEKLYVSLLNLVGAQVRPPAAAATTLTFTRTTGNARIVIPAGARIATSDGSATFVVTQAATLAADQKSVEAPALHCDMTEAEAVGVGTGAPGQSVQVRRPPIIAPSGDGLDLIVGVEADNAELADGAVSRTLGDKSYRIWREVVSFADAAPTDCVYSVDRAAGRIQFAPALAGEGSTPLASVPALGRDIRVWYRSGGGRAGNVVPGALTVFKTPIADLAVTNLAQAAGGADAETVQAAMRRGPLELTSMRCAVTARDFERVALSVGAVARAKAYAQSQVWAHAAPGVVEILLVPAVDVEKLPDAGVTAQTVIERRSEELRARVQKAVDQRRPLGVQTAVGWARVRPVSVAARVVVSREEDAPAVEARLRTRLNKLFSPLRDEPFGQVLRASDVYEAMLADPSVRYADQLRLTIGEAPDRDVSDLLRDPHQARTWFAATNQGLHRSLDDGGTWSVVFKAEGDRPLFVRRHRDRPGLVALGVVRKAGGAIHVSRDCGETWKTEAAVFNSEVSDADWVDREGSPLLLIATAEGLRQLKPFGDAGPAPVVVDKARDTKGFYAVTASVSSAGVVQVAVAARAKGGVYLSAMGGVSDSFHSVGLVGQDIRSLTVQRFNARDFLWAAAAAEAGQQGSGAFRVELRSGGADDPEGFKPFNVGWQGGSCEGLAFADQWVFAGSNRGGVLALDTTVAAPAWRAAPLDAGLPIRDTERLLHVVSCVAAAPVAGGAPMVFAGGPMGVYRSLDGALHFATASATVFTDRIPLPPNWLYCADQHHLSVVIDDDTGG